MYPVCEVYQRHVSRGLLLLTSFVTPTAGDVAMSSRPSHFFE